MSATGRIGPAQPPESARQTNFIRQIIDRDIAEGRIRGPVITRFPPEPNGYLHIGHAKSICLNFGIARDYHGLCSLRFDDTNPHRENQEYVDAIIDDVRWLGFDWGDRLYFASDYFERLYEFAVELIRAGKAFVCDQTPEELRAWRGTLTEPGRPSPNRDRPVTENLDLFRRMRAGEFGDGARTLRARIDMASPNLNLRDPVLYRIKRGAVHHRTGEAWCIYPTYDYTHPLSDALEQVTHSLCTLEFEDHRLLYDWVVENVSAPSRPRQYEFSRLSLDYTVMSKRLLTLLVSESRVAGWDDPRMPTISGMRRRGYPPAAIRDFCERIGVTRNEQHVELGFLENCVRENLDRTAPRAMAVLDPLRVVIESYPEDAEEEFEAWNHPGDPSMGKRRVPFSREILIERDDFMEDPPHRFFRLAPGREVRLRYAYLVTCTGVVHDDHGNVVELRCRHDPASRGGTSPDGRKVRGTLHWVSARHAQTATVRLYDRLFRVSHPTRDRDVDFRSHLNPDSLGIVEGCRVEPWLADARPGSRFQFERLGYFCVDPDSRSGTPVFNRTVTLRDSWARERDRR